MNKAPSLKRQLESLGFSKNLSCVYLTLIQKGILKAGEIIDITGLQRSVVYSCIKELLNRGLISKHSKNGVAVFIAHELDALVGEYRKKLFEAEETVKMLEQERAVLEREAYIYEGNNIVTSVARRSLRAKPGSTVYFLGASKFGIQANLEQFWKKYHKSREEKRIKCKILYDRFTAKEVLLERNTYWSCEARYLPIDIEIPMSFNIWNDYVALLLPGDHPPTTFMIRSQSTADALVEYFNYLWKHAK